MLKPLFIDLMNRIQAKRELHRFKKLINGNASSMAVMLTLSGSLQPPRFSSWWLK